MLVSNALGHGAVAGGLVIVLIAWAAVTGHRRLRRIGLAALVAILASAILANVVKLAVELPRPNPWHSSYGFPSGHTTTAFAVTAVLGRAVPAAAPILYLFALLTGIARLYLRAHFTIDVLGGAALGILTGLVIARRLLGPAIGEDRSPRMSRPWRWAWTLPVAVLLVTVSFFLSYERTLSAQHPGGAASAPPDAAIEFGTPAGRALLLSGWSEDERWHGTVPFVWAEGIHALARLPSLPPVDHRLRLRLLPFVPREGLSCQRVELSLNGMLVGRLLLDRGWHDYEVAVPRGLLAAGPSEVGFRFAYAGLPGPAESSDGRRLSVAVAALEARADAERSR